MNDSFIDEELMNFETEWVDTFYKVIRISCVFMGKPYNMLIDMFSGIHRPDGQPEIFYARYVPPKNIKKKFEQKIFERLKEIYPEFFVPVF